MTDPAERRRTRRVVEATLWTVAAAVLVGAGVFLLIERPSAEGDPVAIPVVTVPSPSPSPSPSVAPSPEPPPPPPAPRADPKIRAAAKPELDVESILGPPPGPQNDPRPARTAAPADRYAFLVGVTDYRPPTKDTIGSANDVRYIAAELENSGWLPQNIRMVTDGQATGAAIREGMSWLTAKSTPGTFALFHYSGHVKQKGGTKEALWPVDRAFIDDREVTALLGSARPTPTATGAPRSVRRCATRSTTRRPSPWGRSRTAGRPRSSPGHPTSAGRWPTRRHDSHQDNAESVRAARVTDLPAPKAVPCRKVTATAPEPPRRRPASVPAATCRVAG